MFLVYILIVVFTLLISYPIILAYSNNSLIEGLENGDPKSEYKSYNANDPNNALILAQQNAGNIKVLREQTDKLNDIPETITQMQQNMSTMQTQIDSITQQQAQYAQEISGGDTPPDTSGTEPLTTDDAEEDTEDTEDN